MILFAAFAAEEQGLLGSEYLAMHLPVSPGKISLDMNFETLTSIGDPEEVEVLGAERTTFYPTVEEAAKTLGLTIRSEPRPEAGFCYRSFQLGAGRDPLFFHFGRFEIQRT